MAGISPPRLPYAVGHGVEKLWSLPQVGDGERRGHGLGYIEKRALASRLLCFFSPGGFRAGGRAGGGRMKANALQGDRITAALPDRAIPFKLSV